MGFPDMEAFLSPVLRLQPLLPFLSSKGKFEQLLIKRGVAKTSPAAKSLQSCPTVRPHRRQPTRLPHPWDSPGENTGVGCHFLLQCMKVKSESEVAQTCPTLSDPMDCSPPGSSVHGIFQARVLEWGEKSSEARLNRPGKFIKIRPTET